MKHLHRLLLALALLAAGPEAWAQSPTVVDDSAGAGVGAGGQTLVPVANCAATSDAVDSGDFAVAKCNTDRELTVNVDSITAGDNNIGNVDIVTMPSDATELPAAGALGDNTSNPTTTSVGAFPHWFDGSTWDRAIGNATDGLTVNLGSNNDVTVSDGSGALTVDGTVALGAGAASIGTLGANSGVDIGDVTINNSSGGSAVNIQDGGNVITVDGTVTANAGTNLDTSALALESGGNLAGAATSLAIIDDWDDGNDHVETVGPIVGGGIDNTVCGGSAISASDVIGAPGSNTSIYVTGVTFSIGAATASSIKLTISGGADVWGPHYLENISGRGLHVEFPAPIKITANTALNATSTGATTCTLTVSYFTAPG